MIGVAIVRNGCSEAESGLREGMRSLGYLAHFVSGNRSFAELVNEWSPDAIVVDLPSDTPEWQIYAHTIEQHPSCRRAEVLWTEPEAGPADRSAAARHGSIGAEALSDYLTLSARLHHHLSTSAPLLLKDPLICGSFVLEPQELSVQRGDAKIRLRGREYALLDYLARRPDRTFTRGHLRNGVWADEPDLDHRTVDVAVLRLRRSLKAIGGANLIATERNRGYRFDLPADDLQLGRKQSNDEAVNKPSRRPLMAV